MRLESWTVSWDFSDSQCFGLDVKGYGAAAVRLVDELLDNLGVGHRGRKVAVSEHRPLS